jgi:hypothetical protein
MITSISTSPRILVEVDRLRSERNRLERLYPHLESKPQLRIEFLTDLAALQVRADRLDTLLTPAPARKNVASLCGARLSACSRASARLGSSTKRR